MFRHRILLLMLCICLVMIFTGCPQSPGTDSIGWVYNAVGEQTGFKIFGSEDGDVIAVGEALAGNREKGTVYVRFGAEGSILADRIISDLRNPLFALRRPTATLLSNGDVLLAATTALGGNGEDNRLRVLRIDPDGNTLWDVTFGEIELTPKLAVQSEAGDILVAGNHTRGGFQLDVFFLLLSADGNVIQFNQITLLDDFSNAADLKDGEWIGGAYVLTGAYVTGDHNAISVIRLDGDANILSWTRTVGAYPQSIGIEPLGSNLAILAHRSDSPVRLITTDAEGNFLSVSDNLFVPANPDESSGANDFIVDSSGDIVMVGEGTTVRYIGNFFPQITIRPFIAKFTPDGEQIWERSINVRGLLINGVTETADGGYATTGAAPGPNGDVLLNVIRFDRNGNIIN
jgi:hypothetical protein